MLSPPLPYLYLSWLIFLTWPERCSRFKHLLEKWHLLTPFAKVILRNGYTFLFLNTASSSYHRITSIYYPSSLAFITWSWDFQTFHLNVVLTVSQSCRNSMCGRSRSPIELVIEIYGQCMVRYSAADLDMALKDTVFNNSVQLKCNMCLLFPFILK